MLLVMISFKKNHTSTLILVLDLSKKKSYQHDIGIGSHFKISYQHDIGIGSHFKISYQHDIGIGSHFKISFQHDIWYWISLKQNHTSMVLVLDLLKKFHTSMILVLGLFWKFHTSLVQRLWSILAQRHTEWGCILSMASTPVQYQVGRTLGLSILAGCILPLFFAVTYLLCGLLLLA